jgi:site-specific DNA-methyltransferase (adenine-specific)
MNDSQHADESRGLLDKGFYLMDCMEGMKQFPDKFFDLAIVDPPYGGGFADVKNIGGGVRFGGRFDRYKEDDTDGWNVGDKVRKKIIAWDVAPGDDYFKELFRVSRNQIIWGGNYFSLPPTRCFIVWRKLTISEKFTMAMAEFAWASFNENAKVFECAPQGTANETRFHPTQKPVKLYQWLLKHYAKEGDKILDTHVGSASSLIACHRAGLDYWGFEIDPVYYKAAKERLDRETAQMNIMDFIR